MPGMPWDDPGVANFDGTLLSGPSWTRPSLPGNSTQATLAGMGSPSLQPMGGGLTPDMLKRIQLYQAIMGMGRGAGGMQPNPNTNALVNQLQGGGQQGSMGLSPQMMALLNYWQQMQGQGAPGTYPSGGGGVTLAQLAQLLGSPQQMGQPA